MPPSATDLTATHFSARRGSTSSTNFLKQGNNVYTLNVFGRYCALLIMFPTSLVACVITPLVSNNVSVAITLLLSNVSVDGVICHHVSNLIYRYVFFLTSHMILTNLIVNFCCKHIFHVRSVYIVSKTITAGRYVSKMFENL